MGKYLHILRAEPCNINGTAFSLASMLQCQTIMYNVFSNPASEQKTFHQGRLNVMVFLFFSSVYWFYRMNGCLVFVCINVFASGLLLIDWGKRKKDNHPDALYQRPMTPQAFSYEFFASAVSFGDHSVLLGALCLIKLHHLEVSWRVFPASPGKVIKLILKAEAAAKCDL